MNILTVNLSPVILTRFFVSPKTYLSIQQQCDWIPTTSTRRIVSGDCVEELLRILEGRSSERLLASKSSVVGRVVREVLGANACVTELGIYDATYLRETASLYRASGIRVCAGSVVGRSTRQGVVLCCPELDMLRVEALTAPTVVSEAGWEEYRTAFNDFARSSDRIVIAGRVPMNLGTRALGELVRATASSSGPIVLVDSVDYRLSVQGPHPDIVKMNAEEAAIVFDPHSCTTWADARCVLSAVRGPSTIIVTLGPKGAVVRFDGGIFGVPTQQTIVRNPIGAGDTATAIVIARLDASRRNLREVMAEAMAAATRNVSEWDEGRYVVPSPRECEQKVKL